MGFGIVGFIFVLVSQSGEFGIPTDASAWRLAVGIIFVCGSAVVAAFNAYNFHLGRDLSEKHKSAISIHRDTIDTDELQMFYVVLCSMIANIFAAIVNCAIGFSATAIGVFTAVPLETIYYSIAWGAIAYATAGIAHRKANLITHNLGINAMSYARPIFGVALLFVFGPAYAVNIPHIDYFIIGTASIITANLLINFEAERLLGFKALVLSLWACGTLVYLRSIDKWQWVGGGLGYFEALALSATVFTLILSFRVARLASRTQDEDKLAFALFRNLNALASRGVIRRRVCDCILIINQGQGQELQSAYDEARRLIVAGLRHAGQQDRDKLISAEAELDTLSHSRQQGINFGELCALFIFAGITVGLALFSRPVVSGLTGFLIEMLTVLFSAVIVFLAINVLDLQRERSAQILQKKSACWPLIASQRDGGSRFWPGFKSTTRPPEFGGYNVVFQHQARRTLEQWISVTVGIAIVVAYAMLLADKWMCTPDAMCTQWWSGIKLVFTDG